jgi:alpha-aminoadipate carrier protein LysW
MSLTVPPTTPVTAPSPASIACPECDGRIGASVTLPGEILDCAGCGAELEVRSVTPLVVALAPKVEEDWGE